MRASREAVSDRPSPQCQQRRECDDWRRRGQAVLRGADPTFAGLYQINAQVPEGVAPGAAVPVVVQIGASFSMPVTMAIQ